MRNLQQRRRGGRGGGGGPAGGAGLRGEIGAGTLKPLTWRGSLARDTLFLSIEHLRSCASSPVLCRHEMAAALEEAGMDGLDSHRIYYNKAITAFIKV